MTQNTQDTKGVVTDQFVIDNPFLRKMHQEADGIQAFLDTRADLDDPSSLTRRLGEMDAYMARLTDMISRSKAMREYAKTRFYNENEERLSKMTATNSNRIITSHLFEYTVTCDRLSAEYTTLCKLSDNLRTQISFIKEQLKAGL